MFDLFSEGVGETLGAQKWLVEDACFSTSSGMEIRLKFAVSNVAAKATALVGGGGGTLGILKDRLEPGSGVGSGHALQSPSLENILKV